MLDREKIRSDSLEGFRRDPRGRRSARNGPLHAVPRVLAGEENLRLAAELIVPGTTEVAHRNVRLHNTFLRYEIELSVDDSDGVARRLRD